MQIRNSSITFSPHNGSGPVQQTEDIVFTNPITKVATILTGMNVEFSHGNDHHLGNLQVSVNGLILNSTTVRVTATFGLRDWSGDWDDDYDGQILFSVIGE